MTYTKYDEFAMYYHGECLSSDKFVELNLIELQNKKIVKVAQEFGGYIAGGSLRRLFGTYGGSLYVLRPDENNDNNYFKNGGDIDIFFPDRECFNKAIHILNRNGIYVYKETKFSHTIPFSENVYWFENGDLKKGGLGATFTSRVDVNYQLVCANFSIDKVSMIKKFDLYNCMIADNGNSLYVNKTFFDLEKTKTLSIANPRGDGFLATRLRKYISKYGYKQFDQENDSIKKFAIWCKENLSKDINLSRKKFIKGTSMDRVIFVKTQLRDLTYVVHCTDLIPVSKRHLFEGLDEFINIEEARKNVDIEHDYSALIMDL